jgi:hypothetical protein
MRITFNPSLTSIAPIKRVAPKYKARSTPSVEESEAAPLEDVVISISVEARAMALQEKRKNARQEPDGFWSSVSKMLKGNA